MTSEHFTICVHDNTMASYLFLICYERDFRLSISDANKSEVIELFHSTRNLDDQLNIDNNFFDSMVNHIYPSEFQLNKANVQIPRPHLWIYIYLSGWFC